jgi:FOG: WD40 repeat
MKTFLDSLFAAVARPPKKAEEPRQLYDAFISYRHSGVDLKWATWLEGTLRSYRTPRALVARGTKQKVERVFRDVDELHAVSDLNKVVLEALRQSRFLIVICSPRSAESLWVNEEVAEFVRSGRREFILPFLIEDEPSRSFPPALRTVQKSFRLDGESGEPLAADVRGAGKLFRRAERRLATLKLLAPILGCRLDDLRQRERERMRHRRIALGSAVAMLSVVGLGLWSFYVQRQVFELVVHSQDSLGESSRASSLHDPSRALLLSRLAYEKSWRFVGVGASAARDALERAVIEQPLRAEFKIEDFAVRGLAWHRSGLIAAGGARGRVMTWNRTTGATGQEYDLTSRIDRMAFRPGSSLELAVADGSRLVRVLNLQTREVRRLPSPVVPLTAHPSDVAWCDDGKRLATTDGNSTISVWDISTSEPPTRIELDHFAFINSVAWNWRCSALAVGTNRNVLVWRADTRAFLKVAAHYPDAINITASKAEGALAVRWREEHPKLEIASGGQDGAVIVTHVGTREGQIVWRESQTLRPIIQGHHAQAIHSVAWSPNTFRLASVGMEGRLKVWTKSEFSFRLQSRDIATNQGGAWSVAWSPDGKEVATGGEDGTIKIWRVSGEPETTTLANREVTLTVREPQSESQVPKLLVDNRPISDSELVELARMRTTRALTIEECRKYLQASTCPGIN